ncbi:MAG: tyrosinase family protein [Acidobacteria bacterium]|nr:tyrosinase family protein [Acidobacteriota bacterium]
MDVEIQINDSTNPRARFLTWAPSPCRIRVRNPAGITTPFVSLKISGRSTASGGAVQFRAGATGAFSDSITLTVSASGNTAPFFSAGKFGRPSSSNGDVTIEARSGTTLVGSVPVMVRIRKNANTLSAPERDRFLEALAKLNNQGTGRFSDFRDMHNASALGQAHGAPGFLPWHRAYLLDLERELQAIDPSVALPYWRFDKAAPNIFKPDFMGSSDNLGTVQFNPGHPLTFWKTDTVPGIKRRPIPAFNVNLAPPGVIDEAATLALGTQYKQFRGMEGNPHGRAHTRFDAISFLSDASTAPRDPLFFLLHCNVDRLWAQWQKANSRFDQAVAAAYDENPAFPVGHRLADTLWPWNGVTSRVNPPSAPGGTLAPSPGVGAPGLQPRVRDMLDYRGVVSAASRMGFDYDDVKFV